LAVVLRPKRTVRVPVNVQVPGSTAHKVQVVAASFALSRAAPVLEASGSPPPQAVNRPAALISAARVSSRVARDLPRECPTHIFCAS